jgi:hypothetical protein
MVAGVAIAAAVAMAVKKMHQRASHQQDVR